MTVPFEELAGSPRQVFERGRLRFTRRLLISFSNLDSMITELLGAGYEAGGLTGATYPGYPRMVVTRVRAEPFNAVPDSQSFTDVADEINTYTRSGKDKCVLTVDYDLLDLDGLPQPIAAEEGTFLSFRIDGSVEALMLPTEAFKWDSGTVDAQGNLIAVPKGAAPPKYVPITEYHIDWHRVINPPWDAIRATAGKICSAAWYGFDAETLLFVNYGAEREFIGYDQLSVPQLGYRMRYLFMERRIDVGGTLYGWQHTYRGSPVNNPGWDKLVDGNGGGPYQTVTSFDDLFSFAAET